MREALSSLTSRGRMLLAGGITAVVCGMATGMPAMVRVGLFCTLLPLLVVVLMSRARYQLTLHREVTPPRVTCGESATVSLRLVNEGFRPPGSVLVEDEIGYALGARPRFRLEGLARGHDHVHEYRVASDVRGRHQIGPARLTVSDPLGLVEVLRRFRGTSSLVVLPLLVPLTGHPRSLSASTGTRGHAASPLLTSDDSTVRAYRRGDDVRRVHWRSTARLGELMVRQEDLPHRPTSTVLLDVRARAHVGKGAASSFETAVRAAASLVVHLHHEGHDVLLVAGSRRHEVTSQDSEALARSLDLLAEISVEDTTALPTPGTDSLSGERTVVAVLGRPTAGDPAVLASWAARHTRARALVLDAGTWTAGARRRGGVATGSGGQVMSPTGSLPPGWSTVALTPRTDLDSAWRSLA